MTTSVKRLAILAIALTCAAGVGYWRVIWHPERSLSASELSRWRHLRAPVRPMSIQLSCRTTDAVPEKQSKLIPGTDVSSPTTKVCSPEGDLAFSIQASPREFLAYQRSPTVCFEITAIGQVRHVRILQSSGSKDLDAKVLTLIESRNFVPNKCECLAQATVGVEF